MAHNGTLIDGGRTGGDGKIMMNNLFVCMAAWQKCMYVSPCMSLAAGNKE